MLAKVHSAAVLGIDSYPIEIEVNAGWGQPTVIIVGLPDAAVKESRDRVKTAIENSGFKYVMGRTTINLAPADVKKEGPSFDLPIAVGILAVNEQIVVNSRSAARSAASTACCRLQFVRVTRRSAG
jgi:magnesium chelatase family protein